MSPQLFTSGHVPWNKGMVVDKSKYPTMGHYKKHSPETLKRISEIKKKQARKGSDCNFWSGDKIQYRGLHNWIESKLGKPMVCWLCGDEGKTRYHWANIGGYTRDILNWIRLCPACHLRLDWSRREY